jgi:hypothetical protein
VSCVIKEFEVQEWEIWIRVCVMCGGRFFVSESESSG